MLELSEFIYLGIWSFVGSVLGFFSFVYDENKSSKYNLRRCILSIGVGMFISFPLCTYLQESCKYSKSLSILLGGLGAFGIPDLLFKYWNELLTIVINKYKDK